ncbi:serine/threonine protein phosphatase PrpC [Kineothrix alysoides]|uniref:Serine/threonine protein phosphatase PrpC n=1 Tax=Kineothrix alysoides TaxID=1469948 RepID=A0A4R1QRM8_9FIRM|nr:protein phosphatase 2C domain-containing protein [Kineothrix alysoides]TCL56526.1 serine/threonine protein phosphatase PrpC [Kineothrix alysoides]
MYYLTNLYWNTGFRPQNEDSLSLQEVSIKGNRTVFALICDGIGGLWRGEQASGFVAERMTEWFYAEALPMMARNKGMKKIKRAGIRSLYACNEEMRKFASQEHIEFGTTITMMIFYKKHYLLWHSGDTRAYCISLKSKMSKISEICKMSKAGRMNSQGVLKRLTRDHSAGEHILTKCIGSFVWREPDSYIGRIKKKSTFLLCSDGFRHVISEEKLTETLLPFHLTSKEQIGRRIKEIADYSKRQGEKDNISAIVIKTG